MTKIYMGIPSTGDRSDAQIYALRRMEKKYAGKIELVYPEMFTSRIFHDFSRNAYVEQFLASDCDILWFLDSDVVPPDDVLDIVVDHQDKWEVAGAPYPVFMTVPGYQTPQIVFTVYRKGETGHLQASNIPESGTEFVEGIATGCLFIKKHIFSKLTKPYFEFKFNPESRLMVEGEDLGFCKKLGDLGVKFFVDFAKICNHYKRVGLLDVSNTIEIQKQQAVNTYDEQIRKVIARKKLEKELKRPLKSSPLILK